MQAVILAAGKGTRLRPLTYDTPKPLVKVNDKPLIQYNLEKLPDEVDEIILVVNYLKDRIKDYFGNEFRGKKITYITQEEMLGTAHAVKICEEYLKDKFLVLMGDDIYGLEDVQGIASSKNAMLAKEISGEFSGGRIRLDDQGFLKEIEEGDYNDSSILVNAAMYSLDKKFFDYDLVPIKEGKEFGLPQTVARMAVHHPVEIKKADFWHQINDLEGLDKFKEVLSK